MHGVSKDGPQTGCSCPPFETLTAFAPQGEVRVGIVDSFQSRPVGLYRSLAAILWTIAIFGWLIMRAS